jgi:hypothetical protein
VSDLVLHCATARSAEQSIQIWLNRGEGGYELSRTYDLPHGSGPLSFADMSESSVRCVKEANQRSRWNDGYHISDLLTTFLFNRPGARL